MIIDNMLVFPNNAVDILAERFAAIDEDLRIFMRPLRNTDPQQSIGIIGTMWLPDDESKEMLGIASPAMPTIDYYRISVQAFIRDSNEERGLARHSVLSELIRTMIYGDPILRVGLSALATDLLGIRKRLKRWDIVRQSYMSNELDEDFVYLSVLELNLETETMRNGV